MERQFQGLDGIWRKLGITLIISSAVLIVVLLTLANPEDFLTYLNQFPSQLLLLVLIVALSAWVMDGVRLKVLAMAFDIKVSLPMLVLTNMAATFLTLATPFAAGGAPVIVYTLYRHGMSLGQASALVVGGGVASQMALFFILVVVFTMMGPYLATLTGTARFVQGFLGLYGVVLFGFVILAHKSPVLQAWIAKQEGHNTRLSWIYRVLHWLAQLLEEFDRSFRLLFHKRLSFFILSWLAGTLYFVLHFGSAFLLLSGFGIAQEIPVFRYGLSVILNTVPLFTPMPGGTGAAEYAAFYVLGDWVSSAVLGTFIILWRFFTFYLPLAAGGIAFPLVFYLMKRKIEDSDT